MKNEILWKENGWTAITDADAEKHILGVICYAEDGIVKELRIHHNDGEEQVGTAKVDGKNILPISLAEFKKLYAKGVIEIK